MNCAFSGHRPNKLLHLGGYNLKDIRYDPLRDLIKKYLIDLNVTKILSGMALGIDQLVAEIAIEMNIPYIAAIPFVGQETAWPKQSQEYYQELLNQASEIVVVCKGVYAAYKMQIRNQYLVDNSDVLIAIFNTSETSGGTYNCIQYAEKQNKQIIKINPNQI